MASEERHTGVCPGCPLEGLRFYLDFCGIPLSAGAGRQEKKENIKTRAEKERKSGWATCGENWIEGSLAHETTCK